VNACTTHREVNCMVAHRGIVTRKGQVTLPADIRRTLGIHEGDPVDFRVENGEIHVRPIRATLADGYGSIPALAMPKTDAEIAAIVADERAMRHREGSRR